MIPNTFIRGKMGKGLSMPARCLYVYLKCITGVQAEPCNESTTTLAAGAQLSRGAVVKAKQELERAGLITIEQRDREQWQTDIIHICDIWRENFEEYLETYPNSKAARQHHPVHEVNRGIKDMNRGVQEVNVLKKKNSQEKNVSEKNTQEGYKGVFVGQNKRKHAHTTPLETYGDAVSRHDGTQWLGHFPRPRDPEPDPELADAVHDMLQAYYTSYANRDAAEDGPLAHPLLKEAQLLRIETILRDALAILFATGPCDPIALVDQFWGYREHGRKDGNVNVFATGGMLAQLAYECRYIEKEDPEWDALNALNN